MPATGALIGTPASISDRLDAHTERHRRRAVGGEHFGDEAQGVGEVLLARHHGHERGGQGAVADLAALGRSDPAGLTGGERGHVVVVEVTLLFSVSQRVNAAAFMRCHAERSDVQHLRLAALEESRNRGRVKHPDFGGPDGRRSVDAAAVDALTLFEDALADQLLGELEEGVLDLPLSPRPTRPAPRTCRTSR